MQSRGPPQTPGKHAGMGARLADSNQSKHTSSVSEAWPPDMATQHGESGFLTRTTLWKTQPWQNFTTNSMQPHKMLRLLWTLVEIIFFCSPSYVGGCLMKSNGLCGTRWTGHLRTPFNGHMQGWRPLTCTLVPWTPAETALTRPFHMTDNHMLLDEMVLVSVDTG